MKRNIIKFTGIAMISALTLTACHPDRVKEEVGMAAILSLAIKNAASGNCAISLNLGTLYSGAIIQAAVNNTATFTQAEFEQASGTTIGTGQTYATYAEVPYNVKYDAFIKGGGTYDATARTADITTGKLETLKNAYIGIVTAQCSAGATTANSVLAATGFRAGSASVSGSLSSTEITDLAAYLVSNPVNLGLGARTTFAALETDFTTLTCATFTSNATLLAAASAYQARQAYANGTGVLACARIPRSSCTFAGLTTADRTTAFSNAVKAFDAVNNNTDCRKPNSDFSNSMIRGAFTGTPRNTIISGFTTHTYAFVVAHPTTDVVTPISEGSTFPNNKIFPENAYPISPALSNISTNFNVAFPLTIGTTKQETGNGIAYYKASNINLTQVDACEGLSLSGYGPISEIAIGSTNIANRKELTSTKEIAYAFSAENTAAALYATTRGGVSGTQSVAGDDAIACNNSFRSKYVISQAIGGGKLPVLNYAVSGDGGSTSNLTTCLYGGTAAGRTTSGSLLGTTSLAGIGSCPAGASAGAAKFGDSGLDTLSNFPNN